MDTLFEIESFEVFERASQEIINNLYCLENVSINDVEPSIIKAAKNYIKDLISNNYYDLPKVGDILLAKGWNQEKMQYFLDLLANKGSQLIRASLDHHNSSYGETLKDFDWLLKLVFGTSELKTLQYPLLQLILTTVDSNGAGKKNLIDVNKDVLLKIIHKLEKIEEL